MACGISIEKRVKPVSVACVKGDVDAVFKRVSYSNATYKRGIYSCAICLCA